MEAVQVAVDDPELFASLGDARNRARSLAFATGLHLPPGSWTVDDSLFNPDELPGGAFVLAGLLSRDVRVGRRTGVEFLGPGDVIRPWVEMGGTSSVQAEVGWRVHDSATLALLDRDFVDRMAPWPQVMEALMDRLVLRARWLAFHLAVCAQPTTERRVLLLLWHFADRWGRPVSDGALLPARLTHELLAAAVGVSRPTVSTAISELQRTGLVSRTRGGTWRLHGAAPPDLTAHGHG